MPRQKLKETVATTRKRANNEGTIYQRKDGLWVTQVTIGYKPDGKPNRKTVYSPSRQEASKKLAALTNEVFQNGYTTVTNANEHRLEPLIKEWYEVYKEPTIATATQEKIRCQIKKHIIPLLGSADVREINTHHLMKFFNKLQKNGLGIEVRKMIKQYLNQCYENFLIPQGFAKDNPVKGLTLKAEKAPDNREQLALSPEERADFFQALKDNELLRPIAITLMFSGFRPGELIALKWKDVDFEAETLAVKRSAGKKITFDDDGEVLSRETVISNTKTALSYRTVQVPPIVMETLSDWLDRQRAEELKKGLFLTSSECFVFPTKDGTMRTYSGLRELFRRFVGKNGFGRDSTNLYTLRHTFATIMLESGVNPKTAQEMMGHAKVTTTLNKYSHVVNKSVFNEAAEKLQNAYQAESAPDAKRPLRLQTGVHKNAKEKGKKNEAV